MAMSGEGSNRPARLGDVKLQNTCNGWQLWRAGKLLGEGLSTRRALAIVRGELAPEQAPPAQEDCNS
jgi:hypothetical protein